MLPIDVQQAIASYEAKKASGELRFTHDGEFAAMPSDYMSGWVQSHLARHLSAMDSEPRPGETITYGGKPARMCAGGYPCNIPRRADGKPASVDGVSYLIGGLNVT